MEGVSGEAEGGKEAVDMALRHVLRDARLHQHSHPPGPRSDHLAHSMPARRAQHRDLQAEEGERGGLLCSAWASMN